MCLLLQKVSEKVGGAEGTKLDDDFKEMEKVNGMTVQFKSGQNIMNFNKRYQTQPLGECLAGSLNRYFIKPVSWDELFGFLHSPQRLILHECRLHQPTTKSGLADNNR